MRSRRFALHSPQHSHALQWNGCGKVPVVGCTCIAGVSVTAIRTLFYTTSAWSVGHGIADTNWPSVATEFGFDLLEQHNVSYLTVNEANDRILRNVLRSVACEPHHTTRYPTLFATVDKTLASGLPMARRHALSQAIVAVVDGASFAVSSTAVDMACTAVGSSTYRMAVDWFFRITRGTVGSRRMLTILQMHVGTIIDLARYLIAPWTNEAIHGHTTRSISNNASSDPSMVTDSMTCEMANQGASAEIIRSAGDSTIRCVAGDITSIDLKVTDQGASSSGTFQVSGVGFGTADYMADPATLSYTALKTRLESCGQEPFDTKVTARSTLACVTPTRTFFNVVFATTSMTSTMSISLLMCFALPQGVARVRSEGFEAVEGVILQREMATTGDLDFAATVDWAGSRDLTLTLITGKYAVDSRAQEQTRLPTWVLTLAHAIDSPVSATL